MDAIVDHYKVMGLSSGEKGAKLSNKEISKAYKKKALELHPDKRPNDPNAHDNFQKLKSSYEVLMDGTARKRFDELLKVRAFQREKWGKREKQSFASEKVSEEAEERIKRELDHDEMASIFAVYKKTKLSEHREEVKKQDQPGQLVDNATVLEVIWEKCGCDYSASRLREVFEKFGQVEDVVITNRSDEKVSAFIVMACKEDAFSATRSLCDDLSYPIFLDLHKSYCQIKRF